MTNVPLLLVVVAAAFVLYDLWEVRGRSLTDWSILLVCIALLWGVKGLLLT